MGSGHAWRVYMPSRPLHRPLTVRASTPTAAARQILPAGWRLSPVHRSALDGHSRTLAGPDGRQIDLLICHACPTQPTANTERNTE